MSKMAATAPSRAAFWSVVHAARRAGRRVELIPYRKGPKRGERFLLTRLYIEGEMHTIRALYNIHRQRVRDVEYSRTPVHAATLSREGRSIFCVATPRGFRKYNVPNKDLRRRFLQGRTVRTAYINRDGVTPGRRFDFTEYEGDWPLPRRGKSS
jgi:hypothetical protein